VAVGFDFNPDEVTALIEAAVRTFDFTLPGKSQSLGRDLAVRAATGICDRSNQGLDPDGNPWPPNSDTPFHGMPGYATYKYQRYSVDRPGELGGQMLSLLSVLGTPSVSADTVEMTYGTGSPPQRTTSRTGVAMKPSELKATDVEKADWFFEGGREFFAFDDEIAESVVELCGEALDEYLTAAGF
jgi:hypothetical protein